MSYTFDNFFEGNGNQFAKMVSLSIAEAPGKTPFNPFLIYGGIGLGKTHLLQAIGNYAKSKGLVQKVRYVSGENFTIEFISSIQTNTTTDFRTLYRNADLLLLDDIQSLVTKKKTQEEFLHTFDELYQKGCQIVLSSDRPPNQLMGLDKKLISRFNGGLITDIQPLDLETRIAILQKKCEEHDIDLPYEIILFIANNITSNIRELERAIIKMLVRSSLAKMALTSELAKSVVREIGQERTRNLSIQYIQKVVGEYFGIDEDLLRAETRRREVVKARQVSMYLSKQMTNSSVKMIGLHFGERDHSTVIHACQTIKSKLKGDKNLQQTIGVLKGKIAGR